MPDDTSPVASTDYVMTYDTSFGGAKRVLLQNMPARSPRGYIDGCTLSNNATDATNDIDITAGVCRDSTNTVDINVAAMAGKRLDGNWAPGASLGMRNSAVGIADGTYHIYAVAKVDGTQDIYAHTSATIATVLSALQVEPNGSAYVYARRLGSILRESATIAPFTQTGDYFERVTAKNDIAVVDPGISAVSRTLSVPLGIIVRADMFANLNQTATAGGLYALFSALTSTDSTPNISMSNLNYSLSSGATITNSTVPLQILTNTSGQIRSRLSLSNASTTLYITTRGWTDPRGKA